MTVVRHIQCVEIWAPCQEAGTWKCPAAIPLRSGQAADTGHDCARQLIASETIWILTASHLRLEKSWWQPLSNRLSM